MVARPGPSAPRAFDSRWQDRAAVPRQSIFRKKPAPDLIRGGHRFSSKNAIKYGRLERVPIRSKRKAL
jgi:hypothetical protein